ncbi:MAG: hypothetical protein HY268_19670 [Deltaproteobacteria bacterium]|nr:hypothetical protein [Deltaproteobacteria bacterium]
MTAREELTVFYNSLKVRAPAELSGYSNLVGPDLIWLDDEYLNSCPRIAIVGQQVDGWDYKYPEFVSEWSVPDAIASYREFDFAANDYSSPFWQFCHKVRVSAFPSEPEARRKVLWTNLIKFVASDRRPILWKPYAEEALRLQEDILTTELTIAKPNVCLFVTGPNFDSVLERYFQGVRFEALDLPVRQFAQLVHPRLPRHSYRTYHPNYLNRDRKERWDKVLQILSRELAWPNAARP